MSSNQTNTQGQDQTAEIRRYLTRRSERDPAVFRLPAPPKSLGDVVADMSVRLGRIEVAMHQLQVQNNTIMTELFWIRQASAAAMTNGGFQQQEHHQQQQPQPTFKRRKTGQPKNGIGYVSTATAGLAVPKAQFGHLQPYQQNGLIWVPQQSHSGIMWVPQMPGMNVQMAAPTVPTLRRSPRTASFKRKNEDDQVEETNESNKTSNVGPRVLRAANRRIPKDPDSMDIAYV